MVAGHPRRLREGAGAGLAGGNRLGGRGRRRLVVAGSATGAEVFPGLPDDYQ